MAMSWVFAAFALTLAAFVAGGPVSDSVMVTSPPSELLPPKEDNPQDFLPTDLTPPALPSSELEARTAVLFLVNVVAVRNESAESENEILHEDVLAEAPVVLEQMSLFLLVLDDANETEPVDLDEMARDLEAEGFTVDKIVKDGETQLIKIHVNTDDEAEKSTTADLETAASVKEPSRELEPPTLDDSGKILKLRRKRHACLHCKLDELKEKIHQRHAAHHGGFGGGGFGGGGCNTCGHQQQPVYVQEVPVYVYQPQPRPQPHYYPPPSNGCSTCNNNHYGGGGGSGRATATATATATASAGGNDYYRK